MKNPYQEVIDWLRSPEGEQWSETRMKNANHLTRDGTYRTTLTDYGYKLGPVYLGGVLSVKEDNRENEYLALGEEG